MKASFLLKEIALLLLLAILSPVRPSYAEIKLLEHKYSKQTVSLLGETQWRYEFWDWFTPSGTQDSTYGYFWGAPVPV